jgi:DNA polymerase-3 subunit delta'
LSFSLLIGQKLAKDILQNALKSGRVAQAYLFHGPEGVGKETAARAFAQALNCLSPAPGPDACGQCASCIKIARYEHPDIQLVFPIPKEFVEGGDEDADAAFSNKAATSFAKLYEEKRADAGYKFPFRQASSIRILQIRTLIHSLRFRPHEGKKRIFIFLKADRLSLPAAQAFLKTLEEPEKDTLFILLTETPQALLPTILSRCQKVRFAPLTRKDIVEALRLRLGLSPEKARTFAALANGSLGRALALADEEKDDFQAERDLARRLFEATRGEGRSFLGKAGELSRQRDRNKAERVIDFLELWLRDLLVFKEQGEEALVNLDRLPEIRASHAGWEQGKLEQAIAACEDIKAGIRANANLHLALTVLLQRLSRIQRGLAPIPPGLSAWPFMLKS